MVGFDSDIRMTVKLIWDDDSGNDNEKILMPTV
jgi:hypothetical protein